MIGMCGCPCCLHSMNFLGPCKIFPKFYVSVGRGTIFAPFHRRPWNACHFSYRDLFCELCGKRNASLFDSQSALSKKFKRAFVWCCRYQWLKPVWCWRPKRFPYTRCPATDFADPRERAADWFSPLVKWFAGSWTWKWLVVSMTRQQFTWALL